MQKLKKTVKILALFLIKEDVMNSDYFILSIILFTFYSFVHIYVLIDSEVSATAFIDADFAKLHCLELYSLKH